MCDKIKRTSFLILIVLLAGIFPTLVSYSQENPEVKAIQLFDSGNYKEAEKLLQVLLKQNGGNPILNYYYGASRTENGHYGEKEVKHLRLAGKNITPDRLHYYLAIQHHALEDWDQALKLYNQFRLSVPEMEQKKLDLDKKIQLCYNQVNPFDSTSGVSVSEKTEATPEEPVRSEPVESDIPATMEEEPVTLSTSTDTENLIEVIENQVQNIEDGFIPPREALPYLPGVQPTIPDGAPVQFRINNTITYLYTSQFQTEEGKNLFEKAKKLELQQKENLKEAEELRAAYKNTQSAEERKEIATKIIGLENEFFPLEEEIKNTYLQSRIAENEYWENAGPVTLNNFLMKQENLVSGIKENKKSPRTTEEEHLITIIEPVQKASAKASPSELTYKIQIGAYSKGVPAYKQRLYNKLSVIRTIDSYTDEKGVVVYTTGNLTSYEDALKMQSQVKQEGIQDASVVPYFNGKRITLEQAKQLEANNDI